MHATYNGGMDKAGDNPKKVAGNLIRRERKAREWTLERLSEEIGGLVKPSAISNYEQGTRLFSSPIARAFEKALGIPAAKLLGVGGAKMDLSHQEAELIEAFRKLPATDQLAYLKRIRGIAELYGDPVPDEHLPGIFHRGLEHKAGRKAKPKPKKGVKTP